MSTTTEAEKKMSTQEKTRSGVSHIEKNTQEDVGNTLGRAENIKKDFEKKYGENPSQEEVFTTLKGSDTYKDCKTFDDAMRILKEGLDPKKDDTSGKNPDLYNWLKANALSKDTIEKKSEARDFAEVYGEHPTPSEVLKILKERQPDTYQKCKTYEEAMKILETRRAPAHKWIKEHVQGSDTQKEIDEMLGEVGLKEA